MASIVAAAGMWFYVDCVLVRFQAADAAAHNRPRGNLSDLYPRWLGTRELLLHHRNPYSEEITKEIQQGYYGRVLDSSRPNDPKDQQAFAYPLYVVFPLAPLIGLPFDAARIFFHWLLVALTAVSVWWWLRALRWRLMVTGIAICLALMLGSFPAVQGIKLQQLSLLVAALVAASAAFVAGGYLAWAGILLAFATIKPQLAWLFVAWMLLWSASDWAGRRRFVFAFALTMALLLAGAEVVLPGWLWMFVHAVGEYHRYTRNQSLLDLLAPWGFAGKILAGAAIILSARLLWNVRRSPANSMQFGRAIALVAALTVLVVPMSALYNQVLLLPVILVLLRDYNMLTAARPATRPVFFLAASCLLWPWMASFVLTAAYLSLWPTWAVAHWQLVFYATFTLPLCTFVLALLPVRREYC